MPPPASSTQPHADMLWAMRHAQFAFGAAQAAGRSRQSTESYPSTQYCVPALQAAEPHQNVPAAGGQAPGRRSTSAAMVLGQPPTAWVFPSQPQTVLMGFSLHVAGKEMQRFTIGLHWPSPVSMQTTLKPGAQSASAVHGSFKAAPPPLVVAGESSEQAPRRRAVVANARRDRERKRIMGAR